MSHDEMASDSVEIVTEENPLSLVRVQAVVPIQAYYTPEWLARDMANLCAIHPLHKVLEPSAGMGALASKCLPLQVTCFDLNKDACRHLKFLGFPNVYRGDFLSVQSVDHLFDRVLMNPPSHDDRYIDHILHAMKFLMTGGRLVALVVTRFLTGNNEKEIELRNIVQEKSRIYQIIHPSFAVKDVPINACILVIDK